MEDLLLNVFVALFFVAWAVSLPVAWLKGRKAAAVVGIPIPLVSIIAACIGSTSDSWWGRRNPGSVDDAGPSWLAVSRARVASLVVVTIGIFGAAIIFESFDDPATIVGLQAGLLLLTLVLSAIFERIFGPG